LVEGGDEIMLKICAIEVDMSFGWKIFRWMGVWSFKPGLHVG